MDPVKPTISSTQFRREDEQLELPELFRLFKDNITVILSCACLGLIASSIYFGLMPNVYQAKTRLLVETPPKELYLNAQEYSDLLIMPQKNNEFYNTQIEMIKSTGTLLKLTRQLRLVKESKNPDEISPREYRIIEKLSENIKTRRVPSTQLVDISAEMNDPVFAAKTVNTLAQIYVEEYKGRILSLSKEFAQLILSEDPENPKQKESLGVIEDIISVEKNSEIAKLKNRRDDLLKTQDKLLLFYKEGHPEVTAVQEGIVQLSGELDREIQKAVDEWKNSLNGQYLLDKVKIIEYASPPRKPVGPKRFQGILMATLMGFIGGYGLVFLLYQLDPRVKNEEDLIKETGLVCLGTIPKISGGRGLLQDFADLSGEIKDIFAYIRTAILFSLPKEKSKVLLLTSSQRYEGRTSVAVNLAYSFANDGFKTAILDADTREASIHNIFKLSRTPGLTDYLDHKALMQEIIFDGNFPNLKVIPAGAAVTNPSELLSQSNMFELIKLLRDKFDKIIIDTPPLLNIADELILSSQADGVIVVIDALRSDRRLLKKVIQDLRLMNEQLIGGIINQYDKTKEVFNISSAIKRIRQKVSKAA